MRYVDSSADSSPSRTLTTLAATEGSPILLVGGRGKGVPFDTLAPALLSKARVLILFGETGREIASLIGGKKEGGATVLEAGNFREAVRLAVLAARPGDTVLLSPASTSFDEFRNFEERGDAFRAEVLAMSAHLPKKQ